VTGFVTRGLRTGRHPFDPTTVRIERNTNLLAGHGDNPTLIGFATARYTPLHRQPQYAPMEGHRDRRIGTQDNARSYAVTLVLDSGRQRPRTRHASHHHDMLTGHPRNGSRSKRAAPRPAHERRLGRACSLVAHQLLID
jgi:hypothetical protein